MWTEVLGGLSGRMICVLESEHPHHRGRIRISSPQRKNPDILTTEETAMRAITVRDRDAGAGGLSLTDMPYPHAAENDVVVWVHAAGFTSGELAWSSSWTDRAGRDRTPSVPGHDLSGDVAELGYGTTGLTVGQRMFGLADWTRNGFAPDRRTRGKTIIQVTGG
jgi:hypothetical protein